MCLREAWGLEVRRGVRALQAPPLQVLCPFSTFPRHICRKGLCRVTVAQMTVTHDGHAVNCVVTLSSPWLY